MKDVIIELKNQLDTLPIGTDFSDLGNAVGIILGKYQKVNKLGFEISDFQHGLLHGLSLTDGTHKPEINSQRRLSHELPALSNSPNKSSS